MIELEGFGYKIHVLEVKMKVFVLLNANQNLASLWTKNFRFEMQYEDFRAPSGVNQRCRTVDLRSL